MEFLEINQVQGHLCYWLENISLVEGKTAKKIQNNSVAFLWEEIRWWLLVEFEGLILVMPGS